MGVEDLENFLDQILAYRFRRQHCRVKGIEELEDIGPSFKLTVSVLGHHHAV